MSLEAAGIDRDGRQLVGMAGGTILARDPDGTHRIFFEGREIASGSREPMRTLFGACWPDDWLRWIWAQ